MNSSDGNAKIGILRFMGTTDFAKGEWAGVELSEKVGKNDGSVLGKRYFQCEPLYGLFAPANKISLHTAVNPLSTPGTKSKLQQPAATTPITGAKQLGTPLVTKTGLVTTTPVASSQSKLNRQFSGSQESLVSEKSSIYSTASGVTRKSPAANQQQLAQKIAGKTVIYFFDF